MQDIKAQLRRIEDLRATKYITGTLRDVSAVEIKQLRAQFEKNELFARELRELYHLVWKLRERAPGAVQQPTNNQVLYVAFTTNRHFYGAVNHDVMKKFINETSANDRCLIIGDIGKQLWLSHAKKRKELSFVSFAEDSPSQKEVSAFLERTMLYSRVFVYYPGFVSVFVQTPQVLDITFRPESQIPDSDVRERDTTNENIEFLLEPDLPEIIAFFNTQVRYVLFERLLLETQLSRVAARLVKMDTADQNADELILHEQHGLRRAQASFSSRRMLETVVGYIQWHTHKI